MIPPTIMTIQAPFLTMIGFPLNQGANLINFSADGTQQRTTIRQWRQNRAIDNGRTARIYQNAVSSRLNPIEAN